MICALCRNSLVLMKRSIMLKQVWIRIVPFSFCNKYSSSPGTPCNISPPPLSFSSGLVRGTYKMFSHGKNNPYVSLHKSKETFRGERNIAWAPWAAELKRLLEARIATVATVMTETIQQSTVKCQLPQQLYSVCHKNILSLKDTCYTRSLKTDVFYTLKKFQVYNEN